MKRIYAVNYSDEVYGRNTPIIRDLAEADLLTTPCTEVSNKKFQEFIKRFPTDHKMITKGRVICWSEAKKKGIIKKTVYTNIFICVRE